MSTLVVTNDFPPRAGGIESFVVEVARRLPGPLVVHTRAQPGDAATDAALPFPVVRDPSPVLLPTPAATRRVVETARAHGCDRAWFGAAAPLGLMAPALRGAGVRRVVATTHGHEVWWAALPGPRALLRRVARGADVLTVLGPATGARIGAGLPQHLRARTAVLAPGVDAAAFAPGPALAAAAAAVRERHGLRGRPVVVCVSRLVARKGQDVLVRAWPQVAARVPGAALLLVGEGPRRRALERAVARAGLEGDVVLAGRAAPGELAAHYAAGDVFAMPCRDRLGGLETEGLGICYLEAAAAGLPVVAGSSGGAPDAVLPGTSGAVVDGRDPAAVAAALAALLADPALAATQGAAGRAWVERAWGWQRRADALAAMLDPSAPRPPGASAQA